MKYAIVVHIHYSEVSYSCPHYFTVKWATVVHTRIQWCWCWLRGRLAASASWLLPVIFLVTSSSRTMCPSKQQASTQVPLHNSYVLSCSTECIFTTVLLQQNVSTQLFCSSRLSVVHNCSAAVSDNGSGEGRGNMQKEMALTKLLPRISVVA